MELTDYWRILRAHWLAILLCTAVGGLAAFGLALVQPKVFTADASGIVSAGVSEDLGSALTGDNYAKSRVKSYLDIAKSRKVASYATENLGLEASPENLIGRISVTNPLDTAVIKVSASAGTAESARDLAEAWVNGISEQVNELENANAADGGTSIVTFNTLDAAVMPTSPSAPNTRLYVALGLLIGLAVGIGFAVIRNVFDRRIRSTAAIEKEFDVPVIGTIPFDRNFSDERRLAAAVGADARTNDEYDHAVAEAMRELRTNLQFMSPDNPPRIITVTSSLPNEGKSTIVANLAIAVAASGQRVVVVDGDLRRPTVAKAFGLIQDVGLTNVLIGRANKDEVMQSWGDTGLLQVLGAGPVPPNPSELVGSDVMLALLKSLATDALVLVDAPPLIPVTDAAILAARTDGALIVGYARRTTMDALSKALGNLERARGRALGIILNGVPRRGADADPYSYGYKYSGYYSSSPEGPQEPLAVSTDSLEGEPGEVTTRASRRARR